ncbi:hypothetical protein G6F68_017247 [Rhizopus microsporus]|nr:hypothetical protein G6F68_017247 [Rhizopus microsporus]
MADPAYSRPVDLAVRWLIAWLFETKFYLLFSFLFGYSFTLQMSAAERSQAAFAPRFLRRLAGLALLIGEGDPSRLLSVGANPGDLLMGLAALAYALYGVLLRRWGLPVGPWQSLYVQVAFGVLFQLPAFLMAAPSPLNDDNVPLVLASSTWAPTGPASS